MQVAQRVSSMIRFSSNRATAGADFRNNSSEHRHLSWNQHPCSPRRSTHARRWAAPPAGARSSSSAVAPSASPTSFRASERAWLTHHGQHDYLRPASAPHGSGRPHARTYFGGGPRPSPSRSSDPQMTALSTRFTPSNGLSKGYPRAIHTRLTSTQASLQEQVLRRLPRQHPGAALAAARTQHRARRVLRQQALRGEPHPNPPS